MEATHKPRTVSILADHNIEGWTILLWQTITSEGWSDLCPMKLIMFSDVGLSDNANDRVVWRFAQAQKMILLTANRNMEGDDSLEQTIRNENTLTSLPVLTIANLDSLKNKTYREACAERLLEIVFDLENYLDTARIFIP